MMKVALIALKKDNRLLLVLRDDKPNISYPNYWSFLGGEIEKDEKPVEGARREIKEEINYAVKRLTYIGKIFIRKNKLCPTHTAFFFKGNIDKEVIDIELTEGQRLEYFAFEKLKGLKLPSHIMNFIINKKNAFY